MITSYEFIGAPNEPWHFSPANFGRINLLVGASSSGKTRFLNTLFNFSGSIAKGSPFRAGKWNIEVLSGSNRYQWHYDGGEKQGTKNVIQREILKLYDSKGNERIIIDRTPEQFKFLDNVLPKLQSDVPSVTLLKEEPLIQPLHHVFSHMQRRTFHDAGLSDAIALQNVPQEIINRLKEHSNLEQIWSQEFAVSAKIFLLEKFYPSIYQEALKFFIEVFPFIQEGKIRFVAGSHSPLPTGEQLPVFTIKEKGVERWIPLAELSSGMQKVFLIITDILTLPGDSIYIIDEYENSLGINAIDFLPSFLIDHAGNNQFFITTHHPYLINNMPMKTWRIFTRQGSNVQIRLGEDFEARFGRSKQKAFIQLINDPIYTEGVQ